MKCLSFIQRFPLVLRLHGLKQRLSILARAQFFTLPVCLLVQETGQQHYGMTVSGTHPAFQSAPAVRAKAEKGEMAEIYSLSHSLTHTGPSKTGKSPPQPGFVFLQKAEMCFYSYEAALTH